MVLVHALSGYVTTPGIHVQTEALKWIRYAGPESEQGKGTKWERTQQGPIRPEDLTHSIPVQAILLW